MGLFDIFKKKEQPKENKDTKTLLAMPLFINDGKYELNKITDHLKHYWNLDIASVTGDDKSAVLTIDSDVVIIAFMSVPIPRGDIEGAAPYAYNWPTVLDDLKNFTGHAIVSVMSATKPALEKYKLLTKVLHSILSTSDSIGIYQGSQTLLIPKDQYIGTAEELKAGKTPVPLWIYLGLRQATEGNSIYTYGLNEFGKHEMEVIHSQLGLEELYTFISNISAYVIGKDVTLKSGETLGYTADQKINIELSKGLMVEGQTLKLKM
ncbi:MAG: DUF4261 domain-containing protein [Chryseobacterium sp.]|jgi:hypothetical protein|uniref:DUF4261 domain-containing protein n=1 Tax=Chryseobacterium sp. TaxID=1871047 RepID=UPI0028306E36|nr:DUF4261 domain-containing protein [Chryseobacterium sp.]MDR2238611.1 DUF4261 domain-containing protein [Chryseobacterium sp.]